MGKFRIDLSKTHFAFCIKFRLQVQLNVIFVIIELNHSKVGQIERVFESASRQKSWDQFTKAQRKNIAQWKKQLAVSCYDKRL
jgi:hypothetical protein